MKKILFWFLCLAVGGVRLFAAPAGTINFANGSSSKVINGQTATNVIAADGIKAALYWAPAGSNGFVQIGAAVTVGVPLPGLFAGGTRTNGPAAPGGTTNKFIVRAWGGGYATYEQAAGNIGVLIGQSAQVTLVTGSPGGAPPSPAASLLAAGLSGFTLTSNTPTAVLTVNCASNKTVECGTAWAFDAPTASTTCANTNVTVSVTATVTNTAGHCGNTFDATRAWSIFDACGNTNSCSQTVTVVDTTPPTLTCVTSRTILCGNPWSFNPPSATDGCGGTNVTIAIYSTVTNTAGHCGNTFDATRTWTVSDACGNSVLCTQTMNVLDLSTPSITCVPNKTVQCGIAWSFDSPNASDTCSGTNVTLAVLETTTNGICPQMLTRTWYATDGCGHTNQCSQTITLVDTNAPMLICASNKIVDCATNWDFDTPVVADACAGTNVTVTSFTTTNNNCPQVLTRTWLAVDPCGNSNSCGQSVTVLCTNCPVLVVTKSCPPNPVPPGGVLVFTGTVTNLGSVLLTNVQVVDSQPAPGTPVLGPLTLEPGQGLVFTNSYRVPPCACGPFSDTLLATGTSPDGFVFSGSASASCAGTNAYPVPGDMNGDGIVDQAELDAVLANYWAHSQWLYMTNPASLGGGLFQFALTNASGWNFTVLVSSNLSNWIELPGPAYPVYQFNDPNSSNQPLRFYKLRYP